jgi:hypothetical protein
MTDTVTPKILNFLPESPYKFVLYQKSILFVSLIFNCTIFNNSQNLVCSFPNPNDMNRRFIATDFQARLTIRMTQVNPDGLKVIGTDQFVVSADYMNFLSDYTNKTNKCCSSR